MKYAGFLSCLLAAVLLSIIHTPPVWAQGEPNEMPEGWQDLPINEFVVVAQGVLAATPPPSEELISAIHAHAAQSLAGLAPETGVDYGDLLYLYEWGRGDLTPEQQATALACIDPPVGDFSGWTYPRLVEAFRQVNRAQLPPMLHMTLVVEWLADGDIRSVSSLGELALLCVPMDLAIRILPAERLPSAETLDTMRGHVAQQLLNEGADSDLTYEHRLVLYAWARGKLTAEQRTQQEAKLADTDLSTEEMADWWFERMVRAYQWMGDASLPEETKKSLIVGWLESQEIDSIASMPALVWLCHKVCLDKPRAADFSVRWTGFVEAPRDGDYTFSICPINANCEHRQHFARQTTSVWVDGRQVLDSTENGWTHRGNPAALSQGQPQAIRVEFSFTYRGTPENPTNIVYPAIAMLMWEGPGVDKSIVPASAFTLAEGTGNGLLAEYSFSVDGTQDTRTEPTIDHAWFGQMAVLPTNPEIHAQLVNRAWALALEPEYLAQWDSEETRPSANVMWLEPTLLTLMDSSQHASVASELLARPVLLETYSSLSQINGFYWMSRTGAPEKSLDVLGTWMQANPDNDPRFDNISEIRGVPSYLTEDLVWQNRPNLDLFEERYLNMPDGGCCLPVAYVVCYGHQVEGRITEWIEKLDARLDDDSLTGDRRVNWLLARAHAEEIRHNRPGRHFEKTNRYLAGRDWIELACLAAQSEPVRLRAHKEYAIRLVARERFDGARQWLEFAATRFSDAASAEALAAWADEIDQAEADCRQKRQEAEEAAQQVYIQQLRSRHQRASDAGDDQAVGRYEQLLTAAGVDVE